MRLLPGVSLLVGLFLLSSTGCQSLRQHYATVHAQKGLAALDAGQTAMALAEFQEAITSDPGFGFAYAKMGDVQTIQGDHSAAVQSYDAALKASPYDTDVALRLASTYRYIGKLAEAARAYLYACDIEPGSFKAHLELANCYLQMGQAVKATEYYHRAIDIDPNSAEAFQNLAVAQEAAGQLDLAIRSYLEGVEQNPLETNILLNLSSCYMRQNKWNSARQVLARAVLVDAKDQAAHRQFAYCLFIGKEYDQAETQYRKAIELGKDAQAHAGIGVVMMTRYIAQQESPDDSLRARALQHWQRSLELDPNQPKLAALVAKYSPAPITVKTMSQKGS